MHVQLVGRPTTAVVGRRGPAVQSGDVLKVSGPGVEGTFARVNFRNHEWAFGHPADYANVAFVACAAVVAESQAPNIIIGAP